MESAEPGRTVEGRGVRLHVVDTADGPAGRLPLIWGHGLSNSIESEDELGLVDWSAIRDVARVVRYDARGHGRSQSTADPATYHWRSLALDQLGLADCLGIDRYVAGGASMGCATALHAAVCAPDRIAALVLVIPPTAWEWRGPQAASYLITAELVEQREHDTLFAGLARLPPPDPFVGDPAWETRFRRTVTDTDPVRLARVFRGAAVTDLPARDAIAAISAPTLILAWTGDAGHPVRTATALRDLMPHAVLELAATRDDVAGWTARMRSFLGSEPVLGVDAAPDGRR